MRTHAVRTVLLAACASLCVGACSSASGRRDETASLTATPQSSHAPIPDERAVGRRDAPIRIDVFSDFQCAGCADFQLHTLARVRDEYGPAGKVYIVHHEYPLPMESHANARMAARWALASATVGRYETVADALFRGQARWGKSGDIETTVSAVLTPAELTQVKRVLHDGSAAIDAAMEEDQALGHSFPVHGTPSFRILLRGVEVFADHDEPDKLTPTTPRLKVYENMKKFLDEQLASARTH